MDMIYRRYGANAKDVLASSFVYGFGMIEHARKQEIENKMFLRWVINYQHQMTFTEFKNQLSSKTISDNRSSKEILDEVQELMEKFNGTI